MELITDLQPYKPPIHRASYIDGSDDGINPRDAAKRPRKVLLMAQNTAAQADTPYP